MSNAAGLRDLLYLDFDRVRTLAGQVGVRHDLPAVGVPARALQAELFWGLEEKLRTGEGFLEVGQGFDFGKWAPETFGDGRFVKVTGMVRILDYPWLASVMETMPRMLKVTHRAELSALKQKREAHQITQQEIDIKVKEQQAQLKDLENWKMDELTDVVRELFGSLVRVKVLPTGAERGEMFVGSCTPGHFFEPPAVLAQNYGCDIESAWTLVGLINNAPAGQGATPPLPTGNAVEDMFERLALAVNRVHRVASAPAFPAVALTPLALYRTLSPV